MWKSFKQKSPRGQLSEAEKTLIELDVMYEKRPDGTFYVPGDLMLVNKQLTQLPDLRNVKVGGNFYCFSNFLTSLEGAPQYVGGDFYCDDNKLALLVGAPKFVGGSFYCDDNQLTTLAGAPQQVVLFSCSQNQLASLEGAPQQFKKLTSDFGEFDAWEASRTSNLRVVPDDLKRPYEANTLQDKEQRAARLREIKAATVKHPTLPLAPFVPRRGAQP